MHMIFNAGPLLQLSIDANLLGDNHIPSDRHPGLMDNSQPPSFGRCVRSDVPCCPSFLTSAAKVDP